MTLKFFTRLCLLIFIIISAEAWSLPAKAPEKISLQLKSLWVLFPAACGVKYRGHNISSKAVIDFLNAILPKAYIIAFCDFDPKGFEIALTTTNVTYIMLPELDQAFEGVAGTRNIFNQ